MVEIVLTPVFHRESKCIKIVFTKDEVLDKLVRVLPGCKWSSTLRSWYVPERKDLVQEIFNLYRGSAFVNYEAFKFGGGILLPVTENESGKRLKPQSVLQGEINKEQKILINQFRHWMYSRRYSENTISVYIEALKVFLRYYSEKDVAEITNEDLIIFNNNYILANNLSGSFQNQIVNAVKLFFSTIENKLLNPELVHRPKRQKTLPNVLSKEEVKVILNAHNNLKHKAMLSLIYSCGLRCGELLALKPEHIDSKRGLLIVKQGKGRKDRIVPLSTKILEILRSYYMVNKPKVYLFEGQKKGEAYDARSLQNVLKQSLEKEGIKKPVTLHWLRHSYATHLLEAGTDLRYIQEILGHSRSTTTEIYTHVSTKGIQKVVSPFDSL